jgi:hypothetical protein
MLRAGILMVAALIFVMPSVAQTNAPSGAPANTLNVPSDQGIVARLANDLDASRVKMGDTVQAEITRDVKRGHDTLLKKGSTLTGHIAKVEAYSKENPSVVAIVFDQVTAKGGQASTLNVRIEALAPAPGASTDTLQDGRGMAQTNINSAVGGDKDLSSGELMSTSVGVHGIRGVNLGSSVQAGKQYSVIQCTSGDVKLKKGTQVVFKAPEQ